MSLLSQLPLATSSKGWPWTEQTDSSIYFGELTWPKITIITPSFNQGQYIEETIRSVLLQNYPNLEYLIIDGGSTDTTLDVIKQYDSWINYWVSEEDSGQSNAINKGLKQASGDIINWLNSDDFLETDALFNIALAFRNTSKSMVLSKSRILGEKTWISDGTFVGKSISETISKIRFDQPASFFSRKTFDSIGELNEELHLVMDADLWIRYLLEYGQSQIERTDVITVNFREHEESKTVNNRDLIVVERSKLLMEIVDSVSSRNGLYSHNIRRLSGGAKAEVVLGANDFQLYWLRDFLHAKKLNLAKSIRAHINFGMLSIKQKIVFLKMVYWDVRRS